MRNMLLASAALVAMIGHAEAQDAGYNWSGFYVGAQAGYGSSQTDFSGGLVLDESSNRNDGFIGGVYVGHDWQAGSFVFGALADIDYVGVDQQNLQGSGTFELPNLEGGEPLLIGKEENYAYDVDWLATARVRAGFLPTDRILVYGTGGLAAAGVETSGFRDGFTTNSASGSDVLIGGVIGLGAEFAVSQNWSLKTEYLHYNFNSVDVFSFEGSPTFDPSLDTVKVGLTFRFGP